MKASKYCDYNVGLRYKASWHAHITLTCLMMLAGSCSLEAVISVHLSQHNLSSIVLMPVPYFSQSAAATSCALSLQGVLLRQAVLVLAGMTHRAGS